MNQIPRDRDEILSDYVELQGRLFKTIGCLGDLVDAVREGKVTEDLLEKAERVLGRIQ